LLNHSTIEVTYVKESIGTRRSSVKGDPICEVSAINPKKVSSVMKEMEPAEALMKVAETFSALGDLTRTKLSQLFHRRVLRL